MSKTVLITGCSSGIGKAAAIYFSNKSWNVAATMRSPEKERELLNYSKIKLYKLDVTDPASIQKALAKVFGDFKTVDVLVNNAGFGVDGVFEAIDDKTIEHQFNTNVFGLMRMTRALIPHMRGNNKGTIVQISSMGGKITFPLYSIYHATKWAVEGFSESLQYELRQFNIKIKIIEPGVIKTDFYGRSREKVEADKLPEYVNFAEKSELVSQSSGQNGIGAVKVAKVIFQAANDENWQLRYAACYPAPQILLLRKLIPESLFVWIVRLVYGI